MSDVDLHKISVPLIAQRWIMLKLDLVLFAF